MKSIARLAIGAALVLSVVAAVQPTQAGCPVPGYTINSFGANLISNPDWCGLGRPNYGCYGTPSTSPALNAWFWGQGAGNAARLAGVDTGAWPQNQWIKKGQGTFTGGEYYYPTFLGLNDFDPGLYNGNTAGNPLNWAGSNEIDGCIDTITPTTPFDECTCMLLTDQWNGQGYFALLSAKADALGNFEFFTPAEAGSEVIFAPIPRAEITGSSRNAATGQVTFNINVPPPTGGDYRNPLCGCNFGYRVYAQVTGEGGMVAANRAACTQDSLFKATGQNIAPNSPTFEAACRAAGFPWIPANNTDGTPQTFTPFGATRTTTSVTVNCGDPAMGYDVYLATALGANEGPGGFNVTNVGVNSFQVKCGNYQLAEPSRPRNPEGPGRSGDAPRGRESNRER